MINNPDLYTAIKRDQNNAINNLVIALRKIQSLTLGREFPPYTTLAEIYSVARDALDKIGETNGNRND